MLRKSNAIIVTSANYLETSVELSPFKEKCHVIPLGIPMTTFESCDESLLKQVQSKYGPAIVLAVGRLVRYKCFEYLIRAMRDVPAQLVIVGDGRLRGHLENLIRQFELSSRITLAGNLDSAEMLALYHAYEMMVLPSIARSEAFGIVQLEGMACAKLVINTSLASGVPSDLLAQSMNLLLDNRDLRHRLGTAGRGRAHRLFSPDLMVESTANLYQKVMNAHTKTIPVTLKNSQAASA